MGVWYADLKAYSGRFCIRYLWRLLSERAILHFWCELGVMFIVAYTNIPLLYLSF